MKIHDSFGNVIDTTKMGPDDGIYIALPECPVKDLAVLTHIMRVHIRGNGPDWRDRVPIGQSVHVGPHLVWLVTDVDPHAGVRVTRAMSEAEYLEGGGKLR